MAVINDDDLDCGCCDRKCYKDMKCLSDILKDVVFSYKTMIDAANVLNGIATASRHDVEKALDRALDLGRVVDDLEDKFKEVARPCLKEIYFRPHHKKHGNCRGEGDLGE